MAAKALVVPMVQIIGSWWDDEQKSVAREGGILEQARPNSSHSGL